MAQSTWIVDPADPRAPPQDVWDRMTPAERAAVVASLPADTPLELRPPEGDAHRKLVGKLNAMVAELVDARDSALRRAEDEARRAEGLARQVEALEAELERLRREQ
jgi:hypothetical protein